MPNNTLAAGSLAQLAEATASIRPVAVPATIATFNRFTCASVTDWLLNFEDRLNAAGYPISRFTAALVARGEPTVADWCRSNIRNLPWPSARQRFLRHYITDDVVSVHREAFERITRRQREGILAFADRYLQALRRAELDPDSPGRVTHSAVAPVHAEGPVRREAR